MKKIYLAAFFTIAAYGFSYSQQGITINASDMPNTGDEYLVDAATTNINFNQTATGQGFIWDYSGLQANSYRVDSFLNVLQTPLIYNFVFNNFFAPNQATVASNKAVLPSFGQLPLPVTFSNEYTYYREENSLYKQVGFAFTATYNNTDIPLPIKFDPVDELYTFPLNFSTPEHNSVSRYEFDIPNFITYKQSRNRTTTVDGYGTLLLPNKTLDVIRLRSESVLRDSIRIDSLGFWFPTQPRTEIEYKWMANGYGEPVLEIKGQQVNFPNNGFQVSSIRYRHFDALPAGLANNAAAQINVYPVPATNFVVINAKDIQQVTLKNLDGKLIFEDKVDKNTSGDYTFTFGNLKPAAGLYILSVKTNTATHTIKLPVE